MDALIFVTLLIIAGLMAAAVGGIFALYSKQE